MCCDIKRLKGIFSSTLLWGYPLVPENISFGRDVIVLEEACCLQNREPTRVYKPIDEVVLCPRLVPLNDNDLLGDAKMKGSRIHSFSNTYIASTEGGSTRSLSI